MPKLSSPLVLSSVVISFIVATGSAGAANNHSWVSSAGTGTTCSRAAPCGDFQNAHNATNPGGVVSVLDSDDYSGATITKSLTIRAEGVDGGNTLIGISGGIFNIDAGPNDVVTLEGLHLNSAGIKFNSGGQLHIIRCVIANQNNSGDAGIRFRPDSASRLSVTDSVISNNGGPFTGGGIIVNPQAGGSARVALERVTVSGNTFGIAADGTGSSAGINVTIADSMISGNTNDGIIATTPSGGAPIGVLVTNTKSVNNSIGIRSIGASVTVRVESSKVTGNGTGLSFSSGGALLSFGNNAVQANATNGAFSGSVPLQ